MLTETLKGATNFHWGGGGQESGKDLAGQTEKKINYCPILCGLCLENAKNF